MTSLRGEINTEGRGNQVYRMAASYYDKDNIAELSPGEIAFFAKLGQVSAIYGRLNLSGRCNF